MLQLLAMTMFVFGMTPGTIDAFHNGEPYGSYEAPQGNFQFDGPSGNWELVGTTPIPPDCAELAPIGVSINAPCGNTPWEAIFSVENSGVVAAGSFFTRVTLTPPGGSPQIKCEIPTSSLAAGATAGPYNCRLANTVPTTPVGSWTVTICVDYGGTVAEENESNNCW